MLKRAEVCGPVAGEKLELMLLKLPAWVMQMGYPRWKELLMQIWLLHLIQMATAINHNAVEMFEIDVDAEKSTSLHKLWTCPDSAEKVVRYW